MTDEIFVQIFIPSILKTYDLKLSNNLKIFEVRDILFEILAQECDVEALKKGEAVICDKESGIIFNINLSVGELKMRNGSQLMLI
jgi:hypothetical protein